MCELRSGRQSRKFWARIFLIFVRKFFDLSSNRDFLILLIHSRALTVFDPAKIYPASSLLLAYNAGVF